MTNRKQLLLWAAAGIWAHLFAGLAEAMPTITAKAVGYIQAQAGNEAPFFLMFGTTSPHTPIVPEKEFQGKSDAGSYGDYVVQTDDAVGQVVQALKDAGIFENTLLVVSSDNGPAPFMRELIRSHQHCSTGPLRGLKRDTLEGGHRVPFIASWPAGGISGGRRIDQTLSLIDLFATCAGIVGESLESGVAEDSIDMLPALHANKAVRKELVYHASNGVLGLRQGNWVYLRKNGIRDEPDWYREMRRADPVLGQNLLFDLSNDLGQRNNLYALYPERAAKMESRLSELEH